MTERLESTRRQLTSAECRYLRAKSRRLSAKARQASTAHLPVGAAIFGLLWVITVLVANAPLLVVTLFWLLVGGGITIWVGLEAARDANARQIQAQALQSAMKKNAAEEFAIRSQGYVQFEEVDDEGAAYAFQIETDRIVFLHGQEFYASARFPSLDFSLVHLLDEHDCVAEVLIEKRGAIAAPVRVVAAAMKCDLDIPETLETRAGRIENIERDLRR